MIYTSYFAQIRNLPNNIIPIAICGGIPQWYSGLWYKKLTPKYKFFICYEKPSDFCHRHLVADWMRKPVFRVRSGKKRVICLKTGYFFDFYLKI